LGVIYLLHQLNAQSSAAHAHKLAVIQDSA